MYRLLDRELDIEGKYRCDCFAVSSLVIADFHKSET